jgi:hypothetical protein
VRSIEIEQPRELVGLRVLSVAIAGGLEFGFGLELGTRPRHILRIESVFKYVETSEETIVNWAARDTEAIEGQGKAASTLGSFVRQAIIGSDESFRLVFSNGATVFVSADPRFEAWTLSTPSGVWVCTPGGRMT